MHKITGQYTNGKPFLTFTNDLDAFMQGIASVTLDGIGLDVDSIVSEIIPDEGEYYAENARLKIALARLDLLNTINSAVSSMNGETQIWWEYVSRFNMYDVKVQSLAEGLNISQDQLKQIWNLANTID